MSSAWCARTLLRSCRSGAAGAIRGSERRRKQSIARRFGFALNVRHSGKWPMRLPGCRPTSDCLAQSADLICEHRITQSQSRLDDSHSNYSLLVLSAELICSRVAQGKTPQMQTRCCGGGLMSGSGTGFRGIGSRGGQRDGY